ncbi:hypothetical protein Acy02nite_50840 [Actinoplanes cyaneus]|uniref:Uncharacterized protein n=1 Tax=Actinoplanes cyaneus TaxID=52696 RepID=A0A919IKQ5_9ACTN|nr:hypothetical protein [Actinoplanes cyaneus]GID67203.1 hypothetical protein Acy02nite_50840 [Actinoplanes cyaneus]
MERFQRSAFWNLRTRIANVSIVIGVVALMVLVSGDADGPRLIPTVVCAAGAVCGLGVHFSRPSPARARWLLISAVTLTTLGVVALLIVVGTAG